MSVYATPGIAGPGARQRRRQQRQLDAYARQRLYIFHLRLRGGDPAQALDPQQMLPAADRNPAGDSRG